MEAIFPGGSRYFPLFWVRLDALIHKGQSLHCHLCFCSSLQCQCNTGIHRVFIFLFFFFYVIVYFIVVTLLGNDEGINADIYFLCFMLLLLFPSPLWHFCTLLQFALNVTFNLDNYGTGWHMLDVYESVDSASLERLGALQQDLYSCLFLLCTKDRSVPRSPIPKVSCLLFCRFYFPLLRSCICYRLYWFHSSTAIHSRAQVISLQLSPYQTTGLLVSVYAETFMPSQEV